MLSELNNATVPVALGKVIVLSDPDASAAVSIISLPSAVDPSNVIFPLSSVMELALSSAPEPETILVDCMELKPWNSVAPPPRLTVVLPIRNELLTKLLLLIEDPVVNTVPDSFGNVIVLSAVGSVTAKVVSKSLTVDPSKTICPLFKVMEFAVPGADTLTVVVSTNVKPEKLEAVPPREVLAPPIVIEEFAN